MAHTKQIMPLYKYFTEDTRVLWIKVKPQVWEKSFNFMLITKFFKN